VIECYRLSSGRHSGDIGKGAALHGGRWNPIGIEVIYRVVSSSRSFHFSVLPRDFVLTEFHMPFGSEIEAVREDSLPDDWQALSPIPAMQEIGRLWAVDLRSAVLSVPSSIVPTARNFVINHRHTDFERIRMIAPKPFRFDPRLK
jgi:RES domain-containing protein